MKRNGTGAFSVIRDSCVVFYYASQTGARAAKTGGKGVETAMALRSGNPVMGEKTWENFERSGHFDHLPDTRRMTIEGTATKTGILLALATLSAGFTWNMILQPGGAQSAMSWAIGGLIGGLIVALVLMFRPSAAPVLAPVYAVLEGLFLGAISSVLNRYYPGIPFQAVGLTLATMAVMLIAYRSGLIRATEKFKLGILAATGGIMVFYLVLMFARMFGASWGTMMWSSSPLSIGISLVVVAVAALTLVWDFDIIEDGARRGAPKWMEWYGAYGLMVTLVWLYLELLRLLAKLNGRD